MTQVQVGLFEGCRAQESGDVWGHLADDRPMAYARPVSGIQRTHGRPIPLDLSPSRWGPGTSFALRADFWVSDLKSLQNAANESNNRFPNNVVLNLLTLVFLLFHNARTKKHSTGAAAYDGVSKPVRVHRLPFSKCLHSSRLSFALFWIIWHSFIHFDSFPRSSVARVPAGIAGIKATCPPFAEQTGLLY